jgi:predicted DNA-binding transcriptional regulator AlpA
MVGLGRTARYHLELAGSFPRRRRLSPQRVAWLESEILEWMHAREVGAATAPRAALAARGISVA